MSLHERTRAVLPSWLALYYEEPIELDRGDGRHVWDADGNRYLDFFGGILTTMTAHALPSGPVHSPPNGIRSPGAVSISQCSRPVKSTPL